MSLPTTQQIKDGFDAFLVSHILTNGPLRDDEEKRRMFLAYLQGLKDGCRVGVDEIVARTIGETK